MYIDRCALCSNALQTIFEYIDLKKYLSMLYIFQVAMLKKTRHDNLILFMGACMKPPHLAIVTR